MKYRRLGLGNLLKCLVVAAGLLAGFPPTPAVAQSLAVLANFGNDDVTEIDTSKLSLTWRKEETWPTLSVS